GRKVDSPSFIGGARLLQRDVRGERTAIGRVEEGKHKGACRFGYPPTGWTVRRRFATGERGFQPGSVASPSPSMRCMNTTSTQPPNLKPTDLNVPTSVKPRERCSPTEPSLPLSPITASICRHGPASQR